MGTRTKNVAYTRIRILVAKSPRYASNSSVRASDRYWGATEAAGGNTLESIGMLVKRPSAERPFICSCNGSSF
jgi:hypothetical protein